MNLAPYVLDDNDLREAKRILGIKPDDTRGYEITAARITFDEPNFGFLSLFATFDGEWRETYWCDFAMLPVATTNEDGKPLFINCVPLSDVGDFETDATGFAKWDGCREIHNGTHVCSDSGLKEYMNALAATVMQASRLAGYEGDDAK